MLRLKRLVGTILFAAAVAIGLLTLRAATAARANADTVARTFADEQAAKQTAELAAIERKAQAAAELPALNAALAAHVDSATIVDLLDSEDWWQPFRADFPLVRLLVRDDLMASRGPSPGAATEGDLVKAARRQTLASARTTIGTQPYLLAAVRLTAAPDGDPVLILGRAAPSTAVARAEAPLPIERALRVPWAAAGGLALVGIGLMFSRGRKAAAAAGAPRETAATVVEPPVIPILHETTLKFGDPREPRNDIRSTALGTPEPADLPPAGQTVVIVEQAHEPSSMFGRYRLVERLSEGGMSELFIAKAAGIEGFSRSFVLKRLRPELARDKEAVAQFIDEARLQADLVHSNIVPVFDFGVVSGEYFMTQEYIAGRDLGRLMDRHRALGRTGLPSPIAYFAAHETLQALAYAHARRSSDGTPLGIVHRDIAAGNIIMSLAGEVKLSDFGIVKSNDRVSRTQVGVVKGNTNFMSPEQARGQAVDARSDLFSLGLVLYYCLAGEMLYSGNNDLEVLHHAAAGLLRDDFTRIRRLADPAPQILERALALDPNERFQTAAEFADEVIVHMGGGRTAAAQLMRELFGLEFQTASQVGAVAAPPRTILGGFGTP